MFYFTEEPPTPLPSDVYKLYYLFAIMCKNIINGMCEFLSPKTYLLEGTIN